jgi:hypothetical protein
VVHDIRVTLRFQMRCSCSTKYCSMLLLNLNLDKCVAHCDIGDAYLCSVDGCLSNVIFIVPRTAVMMDLEHCLSSSENIFVSGTKYTILIVGLIENFYSVFGGSSQTYDQRDM